MHFKLIEKTKEDLILDLDALFGHFNLNETADLSESLEVFLVRYIEDILKEKSKDFLGLNSNIKNSYLTSENEGLLFSINIAKDIYENKIMNILVNVHLVGNKPNLKKLYINIDGYGSVQEIIFLYPEILNIDLIAINSLLKNIYEVGYNWYQIKIEELINLEKISLTKELYDYIKKIIPSKNLRKHLWFATVTEEYGFRLIEQDVAIDLFERINSHATYFDHSTNRLVAEMLSTRMPKDKILMQKAIEVDQVIDVDIKQAKYSKEGSIYSAAMAAFYGCESFTIQPILVTTDSANIVALYPSDKRNDFEFLINEHNDRLITICKNTTSKIYQAQKLFEVKKTNAGKWGEFFGGFVKAFMD